jgi:pimeloyl-ACP methyl ester carboxylesterase
MKERSAGGIGYLVSDWPLDLQKPSIIFIHGAGGSSLFWQDQVLGLSPRLNAVAVDLPGRGRSTGPGKQTIVAYSDTVVRFISDIGIPDPILCGLSLGGAIVQQVLLDHPGLLKAGILVGTGARMAVAPAFFDKIEKDYNGFVDWLCKICVSKQTDPRKIDPFGKDLRRCRPAVVSGDFQACNRFDVRDQIPAIETPVLVITGAEDKLTPPESGEFLEKGIRTANRVHIAEAGHLIPMEKPEETNQAILKFLGITDP